MIGLDNSRKITEHHGNIIEHYRKAIRHTCPLPECLGCFFVYCCFLKHEKERGKQNNNTNKTHTHTKGDEKQKQKNKQQQNTEKRQTQTQIRKNNFSNYSKDLSVSIIR